MDLTSLEERLRSKIDWNPDGCWLWTAAATHGYGRYRLGGRNERTAFAHRVVYERLVGPIPGGLQLDHLCRNTLCVNPAHLEPVTNQVNTRRGIASEVQTARFKAHLTCPAGHPLFGENLYTHVTKRGYVNKQCRTCRRETKRARRANGARD